MTTYIESKLNPDGRTYDHSEVIEAHKNGAKVEFFQYYKDRWLPANPNCESEDLKYRAVIEDKPTEKELEEEFWDVLEEQGRMWDMQAATLKLIQDKFQSGNAIPVERITLTRAEVNEVFPGLLK